MELRDRIKVACEAKIGRELLPEEVDECVIWFREFADLLCEWARDEALRARLGMEAERSNVGSGGRNDEAQD